MGLWAEAIVPTGRLEGERGDMPGVPVRCVGETIVTEAAQDQGEGIVEAAPLIRVFVIDHHAVVREGLRLLLGACALDVVGAERSAPDVVARIAATGADVLVLDVDLGEASGLDFIPELKRVAPALKILVFTGVRTPNAGRDALLAGAHGFVSKEHETAVLAKAIRAVHRGELWFDRRSLEGALRDALAAAEHPDPELLRIATLTPRERELASLVGEGFRNDEIAHRLSIAEKTVRNQIVDVCSKLRLAGRLELLVFANQHGLAHLGTPVPKR